MFYGKLLLIQKDSQLSNRDQTQTTTIKLHFNQHQNAGCKCNWMYLTHKTVTTMHIQQISMSTECNVM